MLNFMRYLGKTLWLKLGTKLKVSIAYHPKTQGQTEIGNRNLGNLLRCFVVDLNKTWDSLLPHIQFAYNSSDNRSVGMSPIEVVHGFSSAKLLSLLPLPPHLRVPFNCIIYISCSLFAKGHSFLIAG